MDEACFLKTTAYEEVLPMLTKDKGRIILASSHKVAGETMGGKGDKTSFVDIPKLRAPHIFVNNVTHVCPDHISAMLECGVSATCCMCYLFLQPPHISADSSFRQISETFSNAKSMASTSAATAAYSTKSREESRRNMLSELGLCADQVSEGADGTVTATSANSDGGLASEAAGEALCTELMDMDTIVRDRFSNDGLLRPHVSKRVTVYVDPAPTSAGSSLIGMAFVAEVTTKAMCEAGKLNRKTSTYVVIGVEEFDSVEEARGDRNYGMAHVLMSTMRKISLLYDYYFQEFVVYFEANGQEMCHVWRYCADILLEWTVSVADATFASDKEKRRACKKLKVGREFPTVYAAMMPLKRASRKGGRAETDRGGGRVSSFKRRRRDREDEINLTAGVMSTGVGGYMNEDPDVGAGIRERLRLPEEYRPGRESVYGLAGGSGGRGGVPETEDPHYMRLLGKAVWEGEMADSWRRLAEEEVGSYRVGYCLGKDKTTDVFNFYRCIYNNVADEPDADGRVSRLRLARHMCTTTMSPSDYVSNSLHHHVRECLGTMRMRVTGESVKTSGKSKQGGVDIPDDLAVCVIMAVTLTYKHTFHNFNYTFDTLL